jgi:hypothetical protein
MTASDDQTKIIACSPRGTAGFCYPISVTVMRAHVPVFGGNVIIIVNLDTLGSIAADTSHQSVKVTIRAFGSCSEQFDDFVAAHIKKSILS